MEADKKKELDLCENEIRNKLSEEIVARYYFQRGRISYTMRNDEQINQAMKLIQNEEEHHAILSKVDKANKPFNASKKF